MEFWQCSPSDVTVPQLDLDPYRFPGADTIRLPACEASPQDRPGDTDRKLPLGGEEGGRAGQREASDPRLHWPLRPVDRRRLDLHAALTSAGIAPLPGDLEAIHTLASLDDTTHAALVRWITMTAAL
ncbi:hypothetical protein [Streptomyces sp. NPDC054797]